MVGVGRPSEAELGTLHEDIWHAIATRAAEHRLGPLLHKRFAGVEAVPEKIGDEWRAAHRAAALTALAQRRDLIALTHALAEEGIDALALKGAWLAWNAYGEPAERPMRDIDILVPARRAGGAWTVAKRLGYRRAEGGADDPQDWELRFKHLPPLISPQGTWCEIHTRLWEEDARYPPHPEALFTRTVVDREHPQLRYLPCEDLMMHLAVHAVVAHRFDGGPLLLIDFSR
ncbi:MAG: nucleotidyltransferase family protein, partial [Qipengyuania sp.]